MILSCTFSMRFWGFARRGPRLKTRTDLLNHLIAVRGYRRYLEIGVRDPRQNFDKVNAAEKHGVDPNPKRAVTFRMTSDQFFAGADAASKPTSYDLILIDGLHLAAQVERDVLGSLRHLDANGTLVLHDCNPLTEDAQTEHYDGRKHWNGTVWKAWVKLRATRADLSMCVVDIDEGCGVIRRGSQALYSIPSPSYEELDYDFLASHRRDALNLVSVKQFLSGESTVSPHAPPA